MTLKIICPICKSSSTSVFLTRNQVPVHQNLVMQSRQSAQAINQGKLSLAVCKECGFIFNHLFDLSKLSYGEHYDNTQTCSPFFEEYLSGLLHHLIFEENVHNCSIIEIGCGKGSFLRQLVEFEGADNTGYGFDPSYVGPTVDLEGRLKFEKRFYDLECSAIPADVVICRHVIEHVPDPLGLLHTIGHALGKSSHARIFFETPCVEWILRNHVIWDVFYEHCSYFTGESLTTTFENANFKVQQVQHVFGGQYLWLEATVSSKKPVVTKNPDSIAALAQQFATLEEEQIRSLSVWIQKISRRGNVALWGAGAKGVTFANLVDPERKWISCVVDLNPGKQGHYLPGTGHPIVDYRELGRYGVIVAILMNPNYREENLSLLRESRLNVDLINLEDGVENYETNH